MSLILVTGATGTIGSLTARALLDAGASVRVAVRDPARVQDLVDRGAEAVAMSWEDEASVRRAFAGAQAALLVSPFVEDTLPALALALEAAREAGLRHVVRLSAAGADPRGPALARKHGLGEAMVQASGLGWTLLRPTFFVDNLWKFNAAALAEGGAIAGAGAGGRVAWVAAGDVAEVAAAALLHPAAHADRVYELTGPEALTDAELVDLAAEVTGRALQHVALSAEALAEGMRAGGVPAWMIEDLLFLEGVKAQGWAATPTDGVQQALGRAPTRARAWIEAWTAGRA